MVSVSSATMTSETFCKKQIKVSTTALAFRWFVSHFKFHFHYNPIEQLLFSQIL